MVVTLLQCVLLLLPRLEEEKAQAAALAQAQAQSQVQDEVASILAAERALAHDSLQHAIMRERVTAEDERLRAQLLVSHPRNSVELNISFHCTKKFMHMDTFIHRCKLRFMRYIEFTSCFNSYTD